jgi:hypothetical protein
LILPEVVCQSLLASVYLFNASFGTKAFLLVKHVWLFNQVFSRINYQIVNNLLNTSRLVLLQVKLRLEVASVDFERVLNFLVLDSVFESNLAQQVDVLFVEVGQFLYLLELKGVEKVFMEQTLLVVATHDVLAAFED